MDVYGYWVGVIFMKRGKIILEQLNVLDGEELQRSDFYGSEIPEGRAPRTVNPAAHTMQEEVFKHYIGRKNQTDYSIDKKKFSPAQATMLIDAYKNNLVVRVVSAYRKDAGILAKIFGAQINTDTEQKHQRDHKQYNTLRQTMMFVTNSENQKELWVLVFPSSEYVDQVSEYIAAIYNDYETNSQLSKGPGRVYTHHFVDLEKNISTWTNFSYGLKGNILFGDVVMIGNVDEILKGVEALNFLQLHKSWVKFGIDEIFSYNVFVNNQSQRRLVAVRVLECFWGNASAQYAVSLISAGAHHILYGSKAATTTGEQGVWETIAPTNYQVFSYDVKQDHSIKIIPTFLDSDTRKLLSAFDIHIAGTAVTVPTVIGEDQEQRDKYVRIAPACIDCENGHIAAVVFEANMDLKTLAPSLENFYNFVDIHFITDYIYRAKEKATRGTSNLVNHEGEELVKARKLSYYNMGKLFATYAFQKGRLHISFQPLAPKHNVASNSEDMRTIISSQQGALDAGRGQSVLNRLSSHYPNFTNLSVLAASAMIAQKAGYLDHLHHILNLINQGTKSMKSIDLLRCLVTQLKAYSQSGKTKEALELSMLLLSAENKNRLIEIRQIGAVLRRQALAYAHSGKKDAVENSITEANSYKELLQDVHYSTTNKLFSNISKLTLCSSQVQGLEIDLKEVAEELSIIRGAYFDLIRDQQEWWQSNFEKCAVATLFLESAFFLEMGNKAQRDRGLRALYLAHSLNLEFNGLETSETFGEIVNAVSDDKNRFLLCMAMNSAFQNEFEKFIHRQNLNWHNFDKNFSDLTKKPPNEKESVIQIMLGAA
jgi:hypothetical protein